MKKKIVIVLVVLLILLGIGYGIYYIYDNTVEIDTIYDGIYIDGHSMKGKTREDAIKYLIDKKEVDKELSMKLLYGDENSYTMELSEIGYDYDYTSAVDKAYSIARDGNPWERYKKIKSLEDENIDIELISNYDVEMLSETVKTIANNLDKPSVDAVFNFNSGDFYIEEGQEGIKIDRELLAKKIEENIYIREDIQIPTETISPRYTADLYKRINGVIGSYSTAYPRSGQGRKKNIDISAKAINGILVHPGEVVSYNAATGPRQRQYGYEEAPVIINGDLTPGVGGGVCQTSTTLYNALLLSDLSIIERSPHSIPPAYVSKGTDAAVADGYLDLKFRNDFDFPVYLNAWTSNDNVNINIYGDTNTKDYTVKIEPELLETIPSGVKEVVDSSLSAGAKELAQSGRTGYKTETYKSKIRDGQVIEKKKVSSDYYRERDTVYNIGK